MRIDLALTDINKTLNRLLNCFATEFGDKTMHETLEEIKVINNDISENLKRIADSFEKQVNNQTMMNKQIIKNLSTDDAGQTI